MNDEERSLYNSVHPYLTGPLYVEFLDLSFPGLRPGKLKRFTFTWTTQLDKILENLHLGKLFHVQNFNTLMF